MKALQLVSILLMASVLALAGFSQVTVEAKDCAQRWAWSHTVEFRPGFWQPGSHNYYFAWSAPNGDSYRHRTFNVTQDAPLHKGQVLLRFWVIESADGPITEINPAQDTAMQLTWIWAPGEMTRQEAEAFRAATTLQVRWDSGEWVTVPAGPVANACATDNPGHFERSWGPGY